MSGLLRIPAEGRRLRRPVASLERLGVGCSAGHAEGRPPRPIRVERPGPARWGGRRFVLKGLVLAMALPIQVWANNLALDREPAMQPDPLAVTCSRIAERLASVSEADCAQADLALSGGLAVSGTPIMMREYGPLESRAPLGRVLLIGGIHGDEYSSVSIVFKWISILNRYHSGLFHWRIVPLLNPDGLLRDRSQRMNANGVDLNRNFPSPDWEEAAHRYWKERTGSNPRRFPGPSALSEPESQWLAREIESFRPDVIISVHAPHGVLDFDGPPKAPERLGSLELKLLGTYPGSLGRYAGVHLDLPVVTIELPSAGSMPSSTEQRRIWRDLVRWLRTRLGESGDG